MTPDDPWLAAVWPFVRDQLPRRRRLAELPRDREIVAYCRGPYCAFAHEAVTLLREEGFPARRLEDGLPEWQAAGLAVTRS